MKTRRGRVWALFVGCACGSLWSLAADVVSDEAYLMLAGSHHEVVFEPVFQGDAFIYTAGPVSAPAVVLIHGMGDRGMGDFAPTIPVLASDHRVLAFDLPGFGRSSRQNQLYSPAMYAAFVRWAVDRYLDGPHSVIGHSLGGAVALRYAATFPSQVERLVIADAAGLLHQVALGTRIMEDRVPDMMPDTAPKLSPVFMRMLSNRIAGHLQTLPVDMDFPLAGESLRELVLRGNPSTIAGLAMVQEDFSRLLGQVRAPTLILWGANDAVTPLRIGKALDACLATSRLELIPDAGHVPMLDNPDVFNRRVTRELTTPWRGATPRVAPPSTSETGRIGQCANEHDVTFVGPYERIEIDSCTAVRLLDVHADFVTVRGSQVEIEGGEIGGGAIGLEVHDSLIMATALRIDAEVAVVAENSRLDFAAVTLRGSTAAVRSTTGATVVASLCRLSTAAAELSLHGVYQVSEDKPL